MSVMFVECEQMVVIPGGGDHIKNQRLMTQSSQRGGSKKGPVKAVGNLFS
jgi:hypothetical protein